MNPAGKDTRKVYIVDDDSEILTLLEKWLVAAGYEVITATSGEEALARFTQDSPSLVITDLFMNGMSGLDVLSRIHRTNPLLPVIILSGQARIPDAVKATHMGSAAFLIKPVDRDELIENVSRYLRKPSVENHFNDRLIYRSSVMAEQV